MANVNSAGTYHIDTASSLIYTGRIKVSYIIITSDSAPAEAQLYDGTSGSDTLKLTLKNGSNYDSKIIDLSAGPIIFQNGIFVGTMAAGSKIMLITTTAGATT